MMRPAIWDQSEAVLDKDKDPQVLEAVNQPGDDSDSTELEEEHLQSCKPLVVSMLLPERMP